MLRAGRRSLVAQVDIFRSVDDELAATATVNFVVVERDGREPD
jgi:acyl-coenzyme A thioesterase PaaI-like protein